MAASASDKFKKVAPNTGWQLDASGISDASVDHFGLVAPTGLPTGTGVKITVDRVDSGGVKTPSKMERIDGVVDGNNIISCVRGVEGTAQAHAGGAVVEILISADLWNDMMDGILAGHNQDGSHGEGAVSVPAHAAASKTTPVDADEIPIVDSAASNVLKKLTWANFKTAINTIINKLTLTEAPSIDSSATGMIVSMTAGENLAFGNVVYFKSDGKCWKADADAEATAPVMGMALGTINADASGEILLIGIVRLDSWTWTVGGKIYLDTNAGAMTQAQPSGADDVVQVVGIATHADRMYFNPVLTYITHT